jgi:pimeloyl-ACP methyl ester carboxylesterase
MKKFLLITASFLCILIIVFLAGPKFPNPKFDNKLPKMQITISEVDEYIKNKESAYKIKPDNESRIIWANDSLKTKTKYCLLYLHGYAASWYEGEPVHRDFASRYGMNLYIPRLAAHGLDTPEPLIDMYPDSLYEAAKRALILAQNLGEKVILMGTSTGCTLGLKLEADFPGLIHSMILYSPNVRLNNPAAFLLDKPWGLQIARKIMKSNYRNMNDDFSSLECKYWYCRQRLEGVVYLQQLLTSTMNQETFKKVKIPVFVGYYYKDEKYQDQTVRVDALLKMYDQLGTLENMKQKVVFPEAGTHPIACKLFSKQWQEVEKASFQFAEEKLGIVPLKN